MGGEVPEVCHLALPLPGTAGELRPQWGVKSQISSELVSRTWKWKNSRSSCQSDRDRQMVSQSLLHLIRHMVSQPGRGMVTQSVGQRDGQIDLSSSSIVRYNKQPEGQTGRQQAVCQPSCQSDMETASQADQEMERQPQSFI